MNVFITPAVYVKDENSSHFPMPACNEPDVMLFTHVLCSHTVSQNGHGFLHRWACVWRNEKHHVCSTTLALPQESYKVRREIMPVICKCAPLICKCVPLICKCVPLICKCVPLICKSTPIPPLETIPISKPSIYISCSSITHNTNTPDLHLCLKLCHVYNPGAEQTYPFNQLSWLTAFQSLLPACKTSDEVASPLSWCVVTLIRSRIAACSDCRKCIWCASWGKQTLRSLSLSYQKKDGRAWPHPSFFWYDNVKDLKVCFLVTHLI